jgi:hypothetical protein
MPVIMPIIRRIRGRDYLYMLLNINSKLNSSQYWPGWSGKQINGRYFFKFHYF